jgi:hypothetical protein
MNYKYEDHKAAGKSNCQAQYIDNNIGFVTENIPESSLEEVAKHSSIAGFILDE